MSYGIIRIAKVATGAIGGAQIHNERKSDHSNTNPDIDFSRSENNRQLPLEKGYLEQLPYHKRIGEVLRTERKDTKTIRKDAVKMCEVLVTSDTSFFDALTPGQTMDFFDTAYAFLCDRYGRRNMIAATVHMDERTPHMHVDFVPVTKDGRLSAKEVVGFQKDLSRLHDDFFQHVGKRYGLERGQKATETGEKKYNLTVTEFKAQTEAAQKALEASQTVDTVQTRKIPLSNALAVPESDWKRMQEENRAARVVLIGKKTLEKEQAELTKEKTSWVHQKATLDEDTKSVRSELMSLSSQKISLQKEVKNLSTDKIALKSALTRQKTAWQKEQETLSVQQLGKTYEQLHQGIALLKQENSQQEIYSEKLKRYISSKHPVAIEIIEVLKTAEEKKAALEVEKFDLNQKIRQQHVDFATNQQEIKRQELVIENYRPKGVEQTIEIYQIKAMYENKIEKLERFVAFADEKMRPYGLNIKDLSVEFKSIPHREEREDRGRSR